MPLPAIRRYTELVRAGDGNEADRLMLLRERRARVLDQMGQLERCLDLINFKVGVYVDTLDQLAGSVAAALAACPTARPGDRRVAPAAASANRYVPAGDAPR